MTDDLNYVTSEEKETKDLEGDVSDSYDCDLKFCQLFFSEDYGNDEIKNHITALVNQRMGDGKKHFSYSILSQYVFDNEVEDYHINDRCDELSSLFEGGNEFIEKTIEDIKLAYCQKIYKK